MAATGQRRVSILVASAIDPEAYRTLEKSHELVEAIGASEELLLELVGEIEVIIFRSGVTISAPVIAAAPRLGFLIRAGSGLDNLALAEARERGIRVCRVPGPGARAVAELTFAMILSLARPLSRADRLLREGRWPKSELAGNLLAGKTLGIVGAGNIGCTVGKLGAAWDMNVIGCVEHWSQERADALAQDSIELTDLERVLRESDFVAVHASLHESSHHLISADNLPLMKRTARLLNMARGGVVDEQALVGALEAGHISGAALDVHETEGEGTISPLGHLDHVILTPHIGAMAVESQEVIGKRVLALVGGYVEGNLDAVMQPEEIVA